MSKFKVYQWRGVSALSLSLDMDGRKKDIEFPTGSERPRVNARFETSDAAIQEKIEDTNLFRTGKIKVIREYTVAPAAVAAAAPSTSEVPAATAADTKKSAPGKGVYPSVTNFQQAAAKLHEKFDIPMDQLQDPDSVMSEAARNGVTFPNLIS